MTDIADRAIPKLASHCRTYSAPFNPRNQLSPGSIECRSVLSVGGDLKTLHISRRCILDVLASERGIHPGRAGLCREPDCKNSPRSRSIWSFKQTSCRTNSCRHLPEVARTSDSADRRRRLSRRLVGFTGETERLARTMMENWDTIQVGEQLNRLGEVLRVRPETLSPGSQSLQSMSRMDVDLDEARPRCRLRFGKSLASRRLLLSQAMVRSTIQRLGWTMKPFTRSDRLAISVSRSGMIPARAR